MTLTCETPACTLELSFTAEGEACIILKAIRDAYEKASESLEKEPDTLPSLSRYIAAQVETFDRLWREASFRMRIEAARDAACLGEAGRA